MALQYKKIIIYTSEDVHWHGKTLSSAVVELIRSLKLAARCIVNRGLAGCYENGEVATANILDLSYNLPLTIEVIIPAAALDTVLPQLEEMAVDGIVAVADLEVRAYHSTKHLIPQQLRVKEVMTTAPKTVAPITPVNVVINLMLDNSLKGIPVVNADQHPVGIITPNDLMTKAGLPIRLGLLQKLDEAKVNAFLKGIDGKTAQDIMSAALITVKEEQLLRDAVQTMIKHRLKRLPVVNQAGILVGIIARIDILRTITSLAPRWRSFQEQHIAVSNAQPVKTVIERDLETVYPDTPIAEVIAKISREEIQRVVVVDPTRKLVGLISDADLMPLVAGHPGFWDYLQSKLALHERRRRFAELMQHARARTAAEVMIEHPVAVVEDTTVEEAIRLMTEKGFKRLPVVDSQGVFQGMISRDAVLQAALQ